MRYQIIFPWYAAMSIVFGAASFFTKCGHSVFQIINEHVVTIQFFFVFLKKVDNNVVLGQINFRVEYQSFLKEVEELIHYYNNFQVMHSIKS